jgi:hypothetical protein
MNTVQLPYKWINIMVNLSETGMGYQLVTVILKNGKILRNHKVINGSILILEKNEQLSRENIALIKSENS